MVLSAINFKLSCSSNERVERRRTLDDFSCIITKARKAYDITDAFSDGINRILYLAYAITKQMFMSTAVFSPWSSIGVRPSATWVTPSHPTNQWPLQHKARTWVDGFLRHPRAYLRISTTVDYAMCHGVLPTDESLPPMLRHVTAVVFQNTMVPRLVTSSLSSKYVLYAVANRYDLTDTSFHLLQQETCMYQGRSPGLARSNAPSIYSETNEGSANVSSAALEDASSELDISNGYWESLINIELFNVSPAM